MFAAAPLRARQQPLPPLGAHAERVGGGEQRVLGNLRGFGGGFDLSAWPRSAFETRGAVARGRASAPAAMPYAAA
jgi:hypothetical protein